MPRGRRRQRARRARRDCRARRGGVACSVPAVTRRRERRGPRKRPANLSSALGHLAGTGTFTSWGLPQPGHRSRAKALQRSLSRSRHAPADTMKTARGGREGHVAEPGRDETSD